MRLCTIKQNSKEIIALKLDAGAIPVNILNETFNKEWSMNLFQLINSGEIEEMNSWYLAIKESIIEQQKEIIIPSEDVEYCPLYRHPHKIWGIGLNFVDHASDLSERAPQSIPASFMKADTTIIGYGDDIKIPLQSNKATGEAELGIIIGKKCKNIERKDWLNVVAGFTTIIDVTAEDILRKNPRFLTLSKNFDTFFSFGPLLVTPDEIEDVKGLNVATVTNGKIHAQNVVSNMNFAPDFLVSFHSKVMTLLPGDVISTGTPKAVPLNDGDIIECRINGFMPLKNRVRDLKLIK
ncbi:MAG: fumarylacetoacetate hydrolase family protein [Promethearchaeota archaeon]